MSTVNIVATPELSHVPPRVRLDVTDVGSPNLFSVTVTRLNPDGRVVTVRTNDGNPLTLTTSGINRVGLIYDYEMPYSARVTYSTVESPTSTSAEVIVPQDRVWLVHPGVPALSVPVELRAGSLAEEELPVTQGVFYPMGRDTAWVVSDGSRKRGGSSLTVATDTAPEAAAIRALVADAGTLLLNVPADMGLDQETAYIAVSTVTIVRPSDIGTDPHREIRMPFVVVDRPAGGTQSERTYADLLEFASYNDLRNAYPDYLSLLAGP